MTCPTCELLRADREARTTDYWRWLNDAAVTLGVRQLEDVPDAVRALKVRADSAPAQGPTTVNLHAKHSGGAAASIMLSGSPNATWLLEVLQRYKTRPDFAEGLEEVLQRRISLGRPDTSDPFDPPHPYKGADHAHRA